MATTRTTGEAPPASGNGKTASYGSMTQRVTKSAAVPLVQINRENKDINNPSTISRFKNGDNDGVGGDENTTVVVVVDHIEKGRNEGGEDGENEEQYCSSSKKKKRNVDKHRGWKAMPYVIGNETFEKLGTVGTSSNLLVYLTTIFHMKSVSAATMINVFNGTTNIATIFGAFISDAYLGRYRTLGFACVSSFVGMLLLTLTAAVPDLHPPLCVSGENCKDATPTQVGFLLAAMGFLVVGAGGIRPCNLAFGADQFDQTTESGKRGINSFFNWYYFTFTVAMMVSSTVIIYIQSNISWTLGLAIPTGLMLCSCSFFFLGSRLYVKVKPEGSPFTGIAQVLVAAARKADLKRPDNTSEALFNPDTSGHDSVQSKLPYTNQFKCIDKAAMFSGEEENNPWRVCSIQQCEQVKCILRVIPIWSTTIIYYTASVQQQTYVVFQALQSNRKLAENSSFVVPAASFTIFGMLGLTIWVPIYDRILLPRLRKMTGRDEGISLLQRMGIGIFLSIIGMVVSGFVEQKRRNLTINVGLKISSMSGLWLIPQLMISGLSEAFNVIGQLEFYYKEFPEHMRSVAGSFFFCGIAMSSYLSGLVVTVVNRTTRGSDGNSWVAEDLNMGRLDLFYFLIAGVGTVNLVYFVICARWYRYKGQTGSGSEVVAAEMKEIDFSSEV